MTATLYIIPKPAFELLENRPDKTKVPLLAHNTETFEQVYEGLEFLLERFFSDDDKKLIREIFHPAEFIGESINENPFKSATAEEFDAFQAGAIYYLDPEKIARIDYLLNESDLSVIVNAYDAKMFNNNGVYPEVWHDDESEGQFFNKTHLTRSLESLAAFFEKAIENENYVVVFTEYESYTNDRLNE